MKPNKEEFIERIAEKFDDTMTASTREVLAEQVYNVLFDTQLSKLTTPQIWLLSVLLHSEEPTESTDVLKTISETFSETDVYLKNLYKHKDLLPKWGKNSSQQKELFSRSLREIYWERINFITWIQKTLIDIFAIPDNYDVLKEEVRQWFLNEMGQVSQQDSLYLKENFSLSSYNPISWELFLQTNNEKNYTTFESSYLTSLSLYFKRISYRCKKLSYHIWTTTTTAKKTDNRQKNDRENAMHINAVVNSIQEKLDPRYTRDNYQGNQKEQIKSMIENRKNIFVWGNDNLGKSHLVQAAIKKLEEEWYTRKIVYTNGNRMLNEIQKRAAEDRKDKKNQVKTDRMKEFFAAFDGIDVLVIDDVDALGWTKVYTQDAINKIYTGRKTQIIVTSNIPPAQIQWHNRIGLKEWGSDYTPISLMEKFLPVLVEIQPVDALTRKKIAKDMRDKKSEPNLFMTPEISSWVVEFMAEHVSPKIYQQVIESIMINIQWDETDISKKIYEIIENITGKTIIPEKDKIVDVIIEEFNLDDIKKYINKESLSWWIVGNIDRQRIYNDKRVRADSIEWAVLRACIYFIKKYYPKESLESIGEKFNRTNASSLYNEAKEWLKQERKLEEFLDNQIKWALKKKYWLQHNI